MFSLEMPDCPHTSGCPLYRLFVLSANLEMWKQRYCTAEFKACARFTLSETGKPVPPNLLPNGRLLTVHAARP